MKIICFHQSADLYGSDRSFLQVVEYLVASGRFSKIVVVLPRTGPLSEKLEQLGIEIKIMELSLLSKTYLKKFQWGKILFPLLRFSQKKNLIEQYDILYVNTSVIMDFYVLAPFLSVRKILHIREIPAGWLGKMLSAFISKSDALVIFNSESTRQSFAPFKKSVVIHNAFEGFSYVKPEKSSVPAAAEPLKVLLIGRVNTWKGQDFTIEALAKMASPLVHLRIVGSTAAGNEDLLVHLKEKVRTLGLSSQIEFVDFIENPAEEYKQADVVIVPSIKPEPFGRIAIEAMSVGKPVIAANHGGLPEIIQHDRNGFLFVPGDIDSFNGFLRKYVDDRNLLHKHGIASHEIFMEKFSVETMREHLEEVFAGQHDSLLEVK